MKRIKWINGLILAAIWLGSAEWGQAAPTFAVNNTIDGGVISGALDNGICETATGNGVCTLRAAIIKANHWPGGGVTINVPALPPGGRYLLNIPPSVIDDETTGNLNINNTMNIVGEGATNTVIQGNAVASTDGGVIRTSAGLINISGVTIQNGRAASTGGGILVDSPSVLTLTDCTVKGNTGIIAGGGIFIQGGGTLNSNNSTIIGNFAGAAGGIYIQGGGTLNSNNSTIRDNSTLSVGPGGGIVNSGTLTLINSTISGNSAGGIGGGISNIGNLTITNSTISGNSTALDGGGILNGGKAGIFNSTITLNRADANLDGIGTGGGVFNLTGASFNFKNSIIAGNKESAFLISFFIQVPGDCAGTLSSQGFNIVSTPNCTINGTFSQSDPLLGPLQNNGGPTQTHALLSGSPAIDAGETPNCTVNLVPIATDQRGLQRPANGGVSLGCDIGAFELYRFGIFLPVIMR